VPRWLFKTEPSDYSFPRLLQERRVVWEGVSNALALLHLRKVRRGDEILVYHTGAEKSAVGVARAATDPYPDPKLADPRRVVVDLVPVRPLARPVPLQDVRKNLRMREFELLKNGRLSVLPIPDPLWDELQRMSE
jgi:predicted RNA-binding protein with PUA-like domain